MEHNLEIPLYSVIPFILMLASIAVFPLVANHFWEKNRNKLIIALVLGLPTAIWLIARGMSTHLIHSLVYDYVPFIILLGGLFVITGGIFVDGDIEAKPSINALILAIGAVLASIMGTTGAAMLLIRPILKTNHLRKYKVHTVLFFIAVVANCGGLLTPLGDPPLFMMYLRGVPFEWFFGLAKEWFIMNAALIIVYYIYDSIQWKKESRSVRFLEKTEIAPIQVKGKINFIWLAGVVLSVAFINSNTFEFIKQNHNFAFIREAFIVLMAILSLLTTKHLIRYSNQFNWEPIEEVAFLFLGIFITMVPCLAYLEVNATHLGVTSPLHFYYFTGALSSFLDNTPTAVTFYSLAKGLVEQNPALLQSVDVIAGIPVKYMEAICVGAVFFGSMTYIGNGPNFMVKAIAERQNVKMPDFLAYMYKFSLIVLLPIFIIIQILFMHY